MVFMVLKAVRFMFFILFSGFCLNANEYKIPEYEQHVNEIVKLFAIQMKKELGLDCIGDGGRMPHDVEEVEVKFTCNRRATIEEARRLEVYVSSQLVEVINSHDKLRPFLREYPFSSERARVVITFDDEYNRHNANNPLIYQVKQKTIPISRAYNY